MPELLNFEKDYILENDNVLLRPLREDDINEFEYYTNNQSDLWRYSLSGADTPDKLKKYLAFALNGRRKKTQYTFTVIDKKSGRVAGCSRFYDINMQHQTSQLGYTWFGKEFQGTGVNKHSKFLMLSFAFDQIGLERVQFMANTQNAISIAAMKSIGCTVEGILRQNFVSPDGTRRDSIVLSILKAEWNNSVKERLNAKLNQPILS